MEITFSATIKDGFLIKTADFAGEKYYFKIPQKHKDEITDLCDPFVILLIFRMMRYGGTIKINGTVSKSLLDNLEIFVSYWHVLMPELYNKITIIAENEFDDVPADMQNKAVACFSGGLDAASMLYRHKKNLAGRNNKNIEKCVLIKGADIPLSGDEKFEKSLKCCKNMCDDLKVELTTIELNYRYYPHYWETEHMNCMTAVLRLWKDYPYQMMGSSYPVNSFPLLWSTNPVTDYLLSSNRCKVIVDSLDLGRTEKAALIKDWSAGIENLRVCWQTSALFNNCGVCEKCVRTHLNFRAVGVKNLSCMAENFKPENLTNKAFEKSTKFHEDILDYAYKNNVNDEHILILKKKLEKFKNRKMYRNLAKMIDYYRCKVLSKITSGKTKDHYTEKAFNLSGKTKKIKLHVFE